MERIEAQAMFSYKVIFTTKMWYVECEYSVDYCELYLKCQMATLS